MIEIKRTNENAFRGVKLKKERKKMGQKCDIFLCLIKRRASPVEWETPE